MILTLDSSSTNQAGWITGQYFDGRSAASQAVSATLLAGKLTLDPPLQPPTPLTDVSISSRIGSTPRRLQFADGAVIETTDHAIIDSWSTTSGRRSHWLHRLESATAVVLGALLLIGVIVISSMVWGIPWTSKLIAHALPASITNDMGEVAVESMDRLIFYPTTLSAERTAELTTQFNQLLPITDAEYDYRLEFRRGGAIGPNALAFPDGTIIMTDELVELADTDEELQAILLHEIGHLQHRHSLRQIIAHSSLAILATVFTGDLSAAGSLIVGAPSVMMEASYSRDMETEADSYALQVMERRGIATEHFANIMDRLEFAALAEYDAPDESRPTRTRPDGEKPEDLADTEGGWWDSIDIDASQVLDFFSSHPLTEERVARFRQGQPAPLPEPELLTGDDHSTPTMAATPLYDHLTAGHYQQLHALFDEQHQAYWQGNRGAELYAYSGYEHLGTFTPQRLRQLEQWVAQMPASYVAHQALGTYHRNRAQLLDWNYYRDQMSAEMRERLDDHSSRAHDAFTTALKLRPDFTLAAAALYHLASEDLSAADANELLASALSNHPDSYALRWYQLHYLHPDRGGSWCQMRRALREIDNQSSANPLLKLLAGELYHAKAEQALNIGDYPRVVKLESLALQQGYRSASFRTRAEAYEELEKPEAALIDYSNAITVDPKIISNYVDRSRLHAQLGDLDKAMADIDSALALHPYDENALFQYASLLKDLKQYQQAAAIYRKLLISQPELAYPHYYAGWIELERLNNGEAALIAARQAVDADAEWPAYWYLYARAAASLQHCDLKRAVEGYLQRCQPETCDPAETRWVEQARDDALNSNQYSNQCDLSLPRS